MGPSLPSWSSQHTAKTPRHPIPQAAPQPKSRPPPVPPIISIPASMSNDTFNPTASSSRTSSLAGKKRPRESDGDSKARAAASRRTKSVSDVRDGRSAKDREAFQRGLIMIFVPNALKESLQGNMTHYNDLLAHFLPTPTVPIPALPPLLPLLRALTAHVSLLSPEIHSALISAIVALPWATGDERFVKVFVGWAGVLVSAQPGWAKEVVGMAVKGLQWQPRFIPATSPTAPISRRIYHARHHALLSHLLSLIPTLPSVLQPFLIRYFPHKREPEVAQTTWVRNSCELIGYCPELGQRVWAEIVDRMLRIDVEITNAEEDEDEDEEEEVEENEDAGVEGRSSRSTDPFDLLISQDMPVDDPQHAENEDEDAESDPDVDELSSVEGEGSDAEDVVDEAKQELEREKRADLARIMRKKLDGMLWYFFQHIEECMGGKEQGVSAAEMAASQITGSGRSTPSSEAPTPISAFPSLTPRRPTPTPAQSLAHFQTLLNLFSRQILPTSSTQHVPFLLFFAASFATSHIDLLLGLLVSQSLYATTSINPSSTQPVSLNQRVAATVYIGSIVCRARFVTDDQARQVLTYLLAYIDGKLHQARTGSIKMVDELPLFYSVCQAVMLIFCFRWRAFRGEKEGDSVLGEMDMDGESLDGGEEGKWLRDLDILQRALTSELNPLLGCNPDIVKTFAKVAHQTNFAYCFSIIESNSQLANSAARSASSASLTKLLKTPTPTSAKPISTPSRQNSASKAINPSLTIPKQARQVNVDSGLDSYFPFDPFHLPRSRRFIDGIYWDWDDVAGPEGQASDDEADGEGEEVEEEGVDDEEDEEESDSDMDIPSSSFVNIKPGSYSDARRRAWTGPDNGLSSSLEGMSISPIRQGMLGRV